jgi:hypothetical protein
MIRRLCVCGRTGTKRRRSKVSPSEGNEARREGCQEVAASRSSDETGERPFRTPGSEGDAALWAGSWNHAEDTVPHKRVTAKRPNRVRDSDHNVTNRVHLTCTPGSVGAVGGNPHGDPAPGSREAHPRLILTGRWPRRGGQRRWDAPEFAPSSGLALGPATLAKDFSLQALDNPEDCGNLSTSVDTNTTLVSRTC